MPSKKTPVGFLILEALYWYSLPIIFATLYVFHFKFPITGATSHLYFIALVSSTLILSRVIVNSWFENRIISNLIFGTVYSMWIFSTLIYYLLVIIGLSSWKKVITSELIISYSNQLGKLANNLGINLTLGLLLLTLAYLALFLISYQLVQKNDCKLGLLSRKSWLTHVLIISVLTLSISELYLYLRYLKPRTLAKEPIALTLTLGKPKLHSANARQGLAPNPKLDQYENKVIQDYTPNPSASRKNVILIVVDALRPENMGVYGYKRPTTPYLSQLKNEKQLTVFNHVHSSCSESACGLMSLASSRFMHLMPQKPLTLQEVLRMHGYQINMILGGDHTNFYDLKSLYGHVDNYLDGSMVTKDYYMNDDSFVIDRVKSLNHWNKKPTMFQFHLMSSHPLGKRWKNMGAFHPDKPYFGNLNPTNQSKYINYYDNGVIQTDHVINTIVSTLKAKGYLEDAIVVITADHGESIGEHGKYSHANSVYEEQLKIPFLVMHFGDKLPPDAHENLSQVDIAPIILSSLNMNIPNSWNGESDFSRNKRDYHFFLQVPDIGLLDYSDKNHLWKYWKNINTAEEFVYDIKIDNAENHNLIKYVPKTSLNKWHNALKNIEIE